MLLKAITLGKYTVGLLVALLDSDNLLTQLRSLLVGNLPCP